MKKKSTKPKCLLLDANIIIETYRLGVWQAITQNYEVFIPTSIAEESRFFWDSKNQRQIINLEEEEKQGKIAIISAEATEIVQLSEYFDRVFSPLKY